MTTHGGELADYTESEFGPLTDPTPVGPTKSVVRAFFNAYAKPLYPMPADLAGLLDPSVPPLAVGVSPAPASPAIPTST